MAKEQISTRKNKPSPRTHRHVFTLNDEEEKALARYVERYKVQHPTRFIREAVMLAVIRRLEEDHPTLF